MTVSLRSRVQSLKSEDEGLGAEGGRLKEGGG
jgi:hypothetical protein